MSETICHGLERKREADVKREGNEEVNVVFEVSLVVDVDYMVFMSVLDDDDDGEGGPPIFMLATCKFHYLQTASLCFSCTIMIGYKDKPNGLLGKLDV